MKVIDIISLALPIQFFGTLFGILIYQLLGWDRCECKKCHTKVRARELKKLDSYRDVRTFEDHGGTDIYLYSKEVSVYRCPGCSGDIATRD
jgi:hypothetical protein